MPPSRAPEWQRVSDTSRSPVSWTKVFSTIEGRTIARQGPVCWKAATESSCASRQGSLHGALGSTAKSLTPPGAPADPPVPGGSDHDGVVDIFGGRARRNLQL